MKVNVFEPLAFVSMHLVNLAPPNLTCHKNSHQKLSN